MQYVINSAKRIIAVHDDGQELAGLYPGLQIVISKQTFDPGDILPVEAIPDESVFDAACVRFREVCLAIGKLSGKKDFQGGFDEFNEFRQSEAARSAEGISLSLDWSAANENCIYEAKKLGLGQPEWWHQCWSENKK